VIDAYNRIAYGRGNASDNDVAAADRLWRSMLSTPRQSPETPDHWENVPANAIENQSHLG
jgi:hypothetical protein